jgi:hypothetical protein
MAYEMREGSGSLFKNDKDGNEMRPDYRGDALINGQVLEVAAWIKEGKKGKFMSLSFKPKEVVPMSQRAPSPAPKKQATTPDDPFGDVPF